MVDKSEQRPLWEFRNVVSHIDRSKTSLVLEIETQHLDVVFLLANSCYTYQGMTAHCAQKLPLRPLQAEACCNVSCKLFSIAFYGSSKLDKLFEVIFPDVQNLFNSILLYQASNLEFSCNFTEIERAAHDS